MIRIIPQLCWLCFSSSFIKVCTFHSPQSPSVFCFFQILKFICLSAKINYPKCEVILFWLSKFLFIYFLFHPNRFVECCRCVVIPTLVSQTNRQKKHQEKHKTQKNVRVEVTAGHRLHRRGESSSSFSYSNDCRRCKSYWSVSVHPIDSMPPTMAI